jgi:hypothetical protein
VIILQQLMKIGRVRRFLAHLPGCVSLAYLGRTGGNLRTIPWVSGRVATFRIHGRTAPSRGDARVSFQRALVKVEPASLSGGLRMRPAYELSCRRGERVAHRSVNSGSPSSLWQGVRLTKRVVP